MYGRWTFEISSSMWIACKTLDLLQLAFMLQPTFMLVYARDAGYEVLYSRSCTLILRLAYYHGLLKFLITRERDIQRPATSVIIKFNSTSGRILQWLQLARKPVPANQGGMAQTACETKTMLHAHMQECAVKLYDAVQKKFQVVSAWQQLCSVTPGAAVHFTALLHACCCDWFWYCCCALLV